MPHGMAMEALPRPRHFCCQAGRPFSFAACEAVCHGVKVDCIELPPALDPLPELASPWGSGSKHRWPMPQGIQQRVAEEYPLPALGDRLIACPQRSYQVFQLRLCRLPLLEHPLSAG